MQDDNQLNLFDSSVNINTDMKDSYRVIEVDFDRSINGKERKILDHLSLAFPCKDIYFQPNKHILTTYLRAINLFDLKKRLQTLSEKYKLDLLQNPLNQITGRIENIKSYGIKGNKRIFVGYNRERKVKNRKQKVKERGGYYFGRGLQFSKENNLIPTHYTNKIICGDSKSVLKNLPDNCIDLIFTSPPYNFGLNYHSGKDEIKWQEYFDKLFAIFDECIRVLKYGGRIIVNIQPLFSDYIPSHHIVSKYFLDRDLIWKGEILWEKNNYNCKYTAWGSWKSPSSPYLKYTWEFLEIYAKGSLKKLGSKNMSDIKAEEFKKWVLAKWSIAPERKMKNYGHPAMFPEELAERAIKLFSFKGDVVLDPFNGVGTTTAVAKKYGRKYLGIDISNQYCKKSLKRIKQTI